MSKLTLPNFDTINKGITICHQNIQSLNKHFDDLVKDKRFWNADVICLTETWLRSKQNVRAFDKNGFNFYHAAREDAYDDSNPQVLKLQSSKGGGVAVYIKDSGLNTNLSLLSKKNLDAICVNFVSENIVVLTLYRPNILNVSQFLLQLERVIEHYKAQRMELVCLGDFNEDARIAGPIQTYMFNQGFRQMVDFITTEGATTLDHVYVSTSLQAKVEKMPTYYSYHDAIMVTIFKSI